jgi:hypothetical protein
MINLTTPVSLTNGTRLNITRVRVDEDAFTIDFVVQLLTANGGSPPAGVVSEKAIQIRQTNGEMVSRNAAPTLGTGHDDMMLLTQRGVQRANAFIDAYAALKTSRAAFEAHLLSAGYIHASLTGT